MPSNSATHAALHQLLLHTPAALHQLLFHRTLIFELWRDESLWVQLFHCHWVPSCDSSFSPLWEDWPASKYLCCKVIFFALCHTFSNFHLIFSEARLCLFLLCSVPWIFTNGIYNETSDREALKYSCDLFCWKAVVVEDWGSCYLILIYELFVIYFSFIFSVVAFPNRKQFWFIFCFSVVAVRRRAVATGTRPHRTRLCAIGKNIFTFLSQTKMRERRKLVCEWLRPPRYPGAGNAQKSCGLPCFVAYCSAPQISILDPSARFIWWNTRAFLVSLFKSLYEDLSGFWQGG